MSLDDEPAGVREEAPTAFTASLEEIVLGCPGALAAIFSDAEGEAVDYCSFLETWDTKIAAAQWSSIFASLRELLEKQGLGELDSIHVRGSEMDFLIRAVGSGYYLTLLLVKGMGWGHALAQCETVAQALRRESRF
ncbi:MAG: roadblock/LC7 domain-containing protein [Deltaproteobacteria bacterium]|nr:roadblock/LC7 domain-containing protein [Deltaproteobacteria bacterium]